MHIYLADILYVIEDESAYMMDARQTTWNVLPFREFGATKGPIFLLLLKAWQLFIPATPQANRLLTSLVHTMSIPLLYLSVEALTRKRAPALIAAGLWGLIPVAVSLTTNLVQGPIELAWVLAAVALIARNPSRHYAYGVAALLFFLAILTRVSALSFLPLLFFLILAGKPKIERLRRLGIFCLTGAFLAITTAAVIFPIYGWPKTAFFFNMEAILLAQGQKMAYAHTVPSLPVFIFRGLTPVWIEGLPLIFLSAALILLALRPQTLYLRVAITCLFILIAYFSYWPLFQRLSAHWNDPAVEFARSSARTTYWIYVAIVGAALLLPRPSSPSLLIPYGVSAIWLAGTLIMYRLWGRDPTPFYILESIPALCLTSALALNLIQQRSRILGAVAILSVIVASVAPLQAIQYRQYRGTVVAGAALSAGAAIQTYVPEGEAIFTAQPMYAYLGNRPIYKYLTHPGWYLAEELGIVPTEIRRIYFPDLEILAESVERDVTWIVSDWRTEDVYFNSDIAASARLRELRTKHFRQVWSTSNTAGEPITIYKKTL